MVEDQNHLESLCRELCTSAPIGHNETGKQAAEISSGGSALLGFAIYGIFFLNRVKNMGIKEVISAPQSPWQNPFVEREIGSIRRECIDHVIVLKQGHLKNILCAFLDYYHNDRTHLSLGKDSPNGRQVKSRPGGNCKIIDLPRIG